MTLLRVALALVLLTPLARAEEKPATKKIDNPTYASWSKFAVGTSVKLVTEAGTAGQSMTAVHKLVELTADKAVIESTMSSSMAGQTFDLPPQRRDEPKVLEVPAAPPADAPKPEIKEGKGEVTVPAGTFSCTWTETVVAMQGMTSTAKIWQTDAVPGRVVKMESTTSVEGMPPQRSVMTLVEVKKP
jgi:hypothetical protein